MTSKGSEDVSDVLEWYSKRRERSGHRLVEREPNRTVSNR